MTLSVAAQLLVSVAVTMYVPAVTLEREAPDCPFDHEYVTVPDAPEADTVADPVLEP